MASNSAVTSPSVTSAATFQTQERSDPIFGANFMSEVTDGKRGREQRLFQSPFPQQGSKIHYAQLTAVICADFESLVSPHDKTDFAIRLVF